MLFAHVLVPFETDTKKMVFFFQPRYMTLLPAGTRAVQPEILAKNVAIPTAWRQEYFLLRVPYQKEADLAFLTNDPECIRVDALTIQKLETLSIPTLGVSQVEMERDVVAWLTSTRSTLTEVFS